MTDNDLVGRLSDWSSVTSPLAPLTPHQLDVVADLGDLVKDRPRPAHLAPTTHLPDPSSSASVQSEGGDDSDLFPSFAKLELGRTKIDTGQQFLQWIHKVEESLGAEQDQPYLAHQAELERQQAITGGLQGEVGGTLDLLNNLSTQYQEVSRRTTSLHEACQHLLEEQQQLAQLDKELQERLSVFQAADKVAHKLMSPTLSVHSETFLPLLTSIDDNMRYLTKHPEYRESAAHLTKFRACLSRALEMVRSHVRRVLDAATAAASEPSSHSSDPQPLAPSHTAFTLFYGKFRAAAPRVRGLIQEVEERQGEEYKGLLADLENHYLDCRLSLLQPSVQSAVQQLLQVHTRDHTGLVRAGCAFLLHVCEDEFQLHCQFFSGMDTEEESRPALGEFLERLCLVLYDSLRPLIIHVTHLETLAELTAILRNEVVGQHCQSHPQLTAFRRVAGQMLQDVQERLVYRTSVYIRSDILGYAPAPGDLAYPEKLEMMEAIAEQLAAKEEERRGHSRQNSSSSIVSTTSMEVGALTSGGAKTYSGTSPADLHGMWYPPVRRALLTLSKLYRCLEKPIFTGLSQEVLSACLENVANAASSISNAKGKQSSDGQLFEIKHLLILREQIAPFQTEFKVKETSLDFGKIKTAALTMLNNRADLLSFSSNNALLEFLLDSSPGVQEQLRDSRKEVDRRLKTVCEQFISTTSATMLHLVTDLNSRMSAFVKAKSGRLAGQSWADPAAVQGVVTETIRRVKATVPAIQRKMQLYLANRETEFILFRPIRSDILTAFVTLLSVLRAEYTLEEQGMVGCPSQEQLAAILASVMVVTVGRSIRGSLSREVSMSPEEELAARERKRSVKFKDKEVVKRISESENPEFNGSTLEGDQEAPVSDVDNVTRKGEEDERKNITNGNGNFEKEEAISLNNGASDASGA